MPDDRGEIIDAVNRMAVLTDRRDWAGLADVFADEVRVDYSELVGGEPVRLPSAGLVAGWAHTLGRLTCTQHLAGNHLVSLHGERAIASASFQATHVPPAPDSRRWVLGGDWRFEFARAPDGWRIAALTMTPRWETGDRSVLDVPTAPEDTGSSPASEPNRAGG